MIFIVDPINNGEGPKCPGKVVPCEHLCTLCSLLCKEVYYIISPLIY